MHWRSKSLGGPESGRKALPETRGRRNADPGIRKRTAPKGRPLQKRRRCRRAGTAVSGASEAVSAGAGRAAFIRPGRPFRVRSRGSPAPWPPALRGSPCVRCVRARRPVPADGRPPSFRRSRRECSRPGVRG